MLKFLMLIYKIEQMVLQAVVPFAPHYILHLAAYGVNTNQKRDIDALQINVLGTMNIVHVAHVVGCEKLINLGSSS